MHTPEILPGKYIVVEGGETSGKSTLCHSLADHYNAILTRETGGTSIGRQIRSVLHDLANTELYWKAEALLTAADRAQHIHQVVAPAIESGKNVVIDRSWVSSIVYQALANDEDPEFIMHLTEQAIGEYMKMDVLIVLDIPWEEYLKRQAAKGRADRFENMGNEYHRKVLAGYLSIAHDLGAAVIDASQPKDVIFQAASSWIDRHTNRT